MSNYEASNSQTSAHLAHYLISGAEATQVKVDADEWVLSRHASSNRIALTCKKSTLSMICQVVTRRSPAEYRGVSVVVPVHRTRDSGVWLGFGHLSNAADGPALPPKSLAGPWTSASEIGSILCSS